MIKRGLLGNVKNSIRLSFMGIRIDYLRKLWGMDIGDECMISFSANLDKTNPKGIHIGFGSAVTSHATILTHDYTRQMYGDTYVGSYCLIGIYAVIMPGVRVGDNCIIGPCSVVLGDVPSGTVVIGNPARAIATGIKTGKWGRRIDGVAPFHSEIR